MNEKQPDFRDSLAALMAETRGEAPGHPDAERWLAYRLGHLPPQEEAICQEHLVGCRECGDLLLAVDAFSTHPGFEGVEDLSTAASWRLLRDRLEDPHPGLTAATRPAVASRRWSWAVAASLLLAVVGLGAWNLGQQRRLAELRQPRVNAHLVYFSPQERTELDRPATAVAGEPLTLILYPGAPEEGAVYRVVILQVADSGPRPRQTLEGLRPDEDSALTALLPAGLPAGTYRIELWRRRGADWRPAANYLLQLVENEGYGAGSPEAR